MDEYKSQALALRAQVNARFEYIMYVNKRLHVGIMPMHYLDDKSKKNPHLKNWKSQNGHRSNETICPV